jgi:PST family polysaccharide transporter
LASDHRQPQPDRRTLIDATIPGVTDDQNLGVTASRGAAASLVLQIAGQVVAIGATTVVARILTPLDYGVLGLALLVSLPLVGIADVGLSVALARSRRLEEGALNFAFWITIAGAAIGMALALPLGYLAARHWGQGAHSTAVAIGAATGLLAVPAAAPRAMLARSLRFGRLALTDALGIALGAVVSIGLAVAGAGVWALVANVAVRALSTTVFGLAFSGFRPTRFARPRDSGTLLRFGSRSAASTTLSYVGRNADNLVVARYLGAHDLGVYQVAFGVAMLPATYVGITVSAVAVPVYARIAATPDRMRGAFLEGLRYLILATGILAIALWWFAPLIIRGLYGTQWTAAVRILEILCLASFWYPLAALSSSLLFACGRPTFDVVLQGIRAVGVTVLSYAGYRLGSLTGIAWGVTIYSSLNALMYIAVASAVAKIRAVRVVTTFASGAWIPAIAAAALGAERIALDPDGWWTGLSALVAIAAIAGMVLLTQRTLVERVRAAIVRRSIPDLVAP